MELRRPIHLLLCLLMLVVLTAGCSGSPPGDDDDAADDDDTSGDDDDTSVETASYPEEEAFLGLAVGNYWRYDEVVSGGPVGDVDDVSVTIVNRIAGPELSPPQSDAVVAFEFEVDRLFGRDETHWYSIDGSGTMRWVGSEVTEDFFDTMEYQGDNSIVMWSAADELGVVGSSMEGAWFLADIEGLDFSAEASTVETFMYGDGQEVETVGLVVSEADTMVGLQYFKPGWGVLGIAVEVGSQPMNWTVIECSVCPESAGL